MLAKDTRSLAHLVKNLTLAPADRGELTAIVDEHGAPIRWGIISRLYANLAKSYDPRRLDCQGILFRPDLEYQKSARGWEDLFSRGFEIIPVTGDHLTMIRKEPHILKLAHEMKEVVNRFSNKPT